MSHITKILRVLMMRGHSRLRPEISKVQCGFVEDCGTQNAIFIVRMLSERAIEIKKDFYLFFIDYAKAVDSVKHEDLMDA